MQVGTEDATFPLEGVTRTREVFQNAGFKFTLKEIAGHDHDYYGISDRVVRYR
jgi:predicted esterase